MLETIPNLNLFSTNIMARTSLNFEVFWAFLVFVIFFYGYLVIFLRISKLGGQQTQIEKSYTSKLSEIFELWLEMFIRGSFYIINT